MMITLLDIDPIHEVWRSSQLTLGHNLSGQPLPQIDSPVWMTVVVCAIIIFSIFFFDRLILSIETAFNLLFNPNMVNEYLDNSYRTTALGGSMVVVFPLLSLILYNNGLSSIEYSYILITIIALTLFKLLSLKTITWTIRSGRKIDGLMSFFFSFLLLTTLFAIPLIILNRFFDITKLFASIYLIVVGGFMYMTAIFRGRQLIIKSNFSHIFCFLYLCALEIIPFALAIRIITVD